MIILAKNKTSQICWSLTSFLTSVLLSAVTLSDSPAALILSEHSSF